MWIVMAGLSAVFAGLTAILSKCGIKDTDSDVATAVRTVVVLLFSWIMVLITKGQGMIGLVSTKSWIFLILSGIATGASWICYFKALSMGDINKVVPVDKSSVVLSVLFAIVLLGETSHLPVKLMGTVLIGFGTFFMIEKKEDSQVKEQGPWLLYAVLSAVFAALTSILSKIGITGVDSNLGTAIRTCVVLLLAWGIVLWKKKLSQVRSICHKELLFLVLSGIATGASWLCYYYAIQNGVVSVVVPIDKLSLLVSIVFSYIVFKERLSKESLTGLCLILAGTMLMAIFA